MGWTPEFEMTKCWNITMPLEGFEKEFNDTMRQDLMHFNISTPEIVVDIGGGALGGVFSVLNMGKRKILVDPLANEYKRKFNKIPEGIETINAYCNNTLLEDCSVDIIFCFDTLDHCNSKDEYNQSVQEIRRILKIGGVIYFIFPLREKPTDGHPLKISIGEILKPFEGMNVKESVEDNHLYLRGVKI